MEVKIECPPSMLPHIEKVMNGEYNIPFLSNDKIKILDIGANVGAFAVWAKVRFPNAELHCYEPFIDNFNMLKKNVSAFEDVFTYNSAVGDLKRNKLFIGKNNCGECSQYKGHEQTDDAISIDVIQPESLESFDVVKMDCEGAESYIIQRLNLAKTRFVMFEYHSEQHRRLCDDVLHCAGFSLLEIAPTRIGQIVAKYERLFDQ